MKKSLARCFIFGAISLVATSQVFAQQLFVGDKAPDIKVSKWVKGEPVRVFEPGKVYVVEFWATWCGPCKQSIPKLTELAKKYGEKITVIGVSVSEQDTAKVEPFVKEMGDTMDYTVAVDKQPSPTAGTGYMQENWMDAAGQGAIPTAFVVGTTGEVGSVGLPSDMESQQVLDKVLAGTWTDEKAKIISDHSKAVADLKAFDESPLGKLRWTIPTLFASERYDDALKELDQIAEMKGDGKFCPDPKLYSLQMKCLVYRKKDDMDDYYRTGEAEYEYLKDGNDIGEFNSGLNGDLAWVIVDPKSTLSRKDYAFALKVAKRLVELDARKHDFYLDTLAWALYWTGDKEGAVKTEQEASSKGKDPEYAAAIKLFQGGTMADYTAAMNGK